MELDDIASILANCEFFGVCSDEQRRLLAFASELREYEPGEYVYKRGDPSDGAHVLVAGSVLAGEGQSREKLHTLREQGTLLGELGLVLKRPRRSSLRAQEFVTTLYVPQTGFAKLMRQYPVMAERVAARISGELEDFLNTMQDFADSRYRD